MYKNLKILTSALIILSSSVYSSVSFAVPVSWNISGPGTTSTVTNTSNDWDLNYNLPGTSGYNTNTWSVTGVATQNGDATFDWTYSGFHSFFQVTAFLNTSPGDVLVNAGPQNCCTTPSNGFNYQGTYTFTGLSIGDMIGFSLGGSHYDGTQQLQGNLNLVQNIPEPSFVALFGLGLLGLSFARRRKVELIK